MIAVLHGHHNALISWLGSVQERVKEIKQTKPAHEHELRLRLIKPVKGELPPELVMAWEAFEMALKAFEMALKTYRVAGWAYETGGAFDTAWRAYEATYAKCLPQIEALHKIECVTDCPWDGKTIFPGQTGIGG